ncbi:uncharacterized protein LOC143199402 isoform X2 [Rhynchophorus ferrugineus]
MCLKYSGNSDAFYKLSADVIETSIYFILTTPELPANMESFCAKEVPKLTDRIKVIETDLQFCLPSNDTFPALFLRHSLVDFLHFACEKYQSGSITSDVALCMKKFENVPTEEYEDCSKSVISIWPVDVAPTRRDVCNALSIARTCFTQRLRQKCPSSLETKDLNEEFFDYIERPCSGSAYLSMNTYFLLCSLLLQYFW